MDGEVPVCMGCDCIGLLGGDGCIVKAFVLGLRSGMPVPIEGWQIYDVM